MLTDNLDFKLRCETPCRKCKLFSTLKAKPYYQCLKYRPILVRIGRYEISAWTVMILCWDIGVSIVTVQITKISAVTDDIF